VSVRRHFPSAGTAVSLFRAKTVQQRPLLPVIPDMGKLQRHTVLSFRDNNGHSTDRRWGEKHNAVV